MKINKVASLLFSLLFILSMLSRPSIAGNDNSGEMSNASEPRIAFNFVGVEIPTVIKFISEITGKNFLFDDRIKGEITIIAPTKLSIEESFNLFTSVLSLKGYTIIPAGPKTYKIIPSALAKQSGAISTEESFAVNEGYITKLIPVDNIEAGEALQFLRPVISRDGHISSFGPGNMLLVVDSAINIDKVMSILKLIDIPSIEAEVSGIHVYFLENADSTELSQVLKGIVQELQSSYKMAQRTGNQGAAPQAAPMLSVTPDISTNALVIVAPPSDYRNIEYVIKTLDKRRKQVYVEAMIVEAKIDELRDIGTKWRATATHNGEPVLIGGVGQVDAATVGNIITGLAGLSVGGLGNYFDIPVTSVNSSGAVTTQTLTAPGFAALFSLSVFKDSINVLSTPQILTSDNEEAEIFVGENAPFISQRERDVVTTSTVLNSIERTDVGIKLNIKPQITEGDYLKLDIVQEISAVEAADNIILTTVGPTTTKRATKTSVVVKDGRTVVIGGLIQDRVEESVVKIPILGDIPVLEWAFKFKSVSRSKTNLLVFLSPHIVKDPPEEATTTDNEQPQNKQEEFAFRENYRANELLVKFREDTPKDRESEIIGQLGGTVIKYFTSINVYHIRLAPDKNIDDSIEQLSLLPEVLYAEPNFTVRLPPPPQKNNEPQPAPELKRYDSGSYQGEGEASSHQIMGKLEPVAKENDSSPPVSHNANRHSPKKKASPDKESQTPSSRRDLDTEHASSVIDTDGNDRVENRESVQLQQVQPENISKSWDPIKNATTSTGKKAQAVPEKMETGTNVSEGSNYYIQVGAWKNVKYAAEAMKKLEAAYPDTYLVNEGTFHKVRIPGTMDKGRDILLLQNLRNTYNMKPILVNKTL